MKAFKYEIAVSEGGIAAAHGMTFRIFEYYIPSQGVYFNQTGAVFRDTSERFDEASHALPAIEKELDDKLVALIVHFAKVKIELEELLINLF